MSVSGLISDPLIEELEPGLPGWEITDVDDPPGLLPDSDVIPVPG